MKTQPKSNTIATGLAMFSMFFGAGNVTFPLAIGQYAQDKNFFAILGLLVTAIGVPFMGLLSVTLFNGNYKTFFYRLGKYPGSLIIFAIILLIGPFGATPRCIALSYSTIKPFVPSLNITLFSAFSCIVIFLFTFRKNKIIDLLGYVLTPILLFSLTSIIIIGLFSSNTISASGFSEGEIFLYGIVKGYQTMDLLGAFVFSSVILSNLEQSVDLTKKHNYKKAILMTIKAGCIGMSLVALVYVGFSYLAAYNSDALKNFNQAEILPELSRIVLGPQFSIIACIAVATACLTTAIALVIVFAEYLHEEIFKEKISYLFSLSITLILTFFVATLDFVGIQNFLVPVLTVAYPSLILISIVNLFFKLKHFQPIKVPVLIMFLFSLAIYWFA